MIQPEDLNSLPHMDIRFGMDEITQAIDENRTAQWVLLSRLVFDSVTRFKDMVGKKIP